MHKELHMLTAALERLAQEKEEPEKTGPEKKPSEEDPLESFRTQLEKADKSINKTWEQFQPLDDILRKLPPTLENRKSIIMGLNQIKQSAASLHQAIDTMKELVQSKN